MSVESLIDKLKHVVKRNNFSNNQLRQNPEKTITDFRSSFQELITPEEAKKIWEAGWFPSKNYLHMNHEQTLLYFSAIKEIADGHFQLVSKHQIPYKKQQPYNRSRPNYDDFYEEIDVDIPDFDDDDNEREVTAHPVEFTFGKNAFYRDSIYLRDKFQCVYCGHQFTEEEYKQNYGQAPTMDHVVPRYNGGPSNYNNLVLCCYKCNQQKSNQDLDDWIECLEDKEKGLMVKHREWTHEELTTDPEKEDLLLYVVSKDTHPSETDIDVFIGITTDLSQTLLTFEELFQTCNIIEISNNPDLYPNIKKQYFDKRNINGSFSLSKEDIINIQDQIRKDKLMTINQFIYEYYMSTGIVLRRSAIKKHLTGSLISQKDKQNILDHVNRIFTITNKQGDPDPKPEKLPPNLQKLSPLLDRLLPEKQLVKKTNITFWNMAPDKPKELSIEYQ